MLPVVILTGLQQTGTAEDTVPKELMILRPLDWEFPPDGADVNEPYYEDATREYWIHWDADTKRKNRFLKLNGLVYPRLNPGELAPIFGVLYRANRDESFTRLEKSKYPVGVTVEGSHESESPLLFRRIIPLQRKGIGAMAVAVGDLSSTNWERFQLLSIDGKAGTKSLSAEVKQTRFRKDVRKLHVGDSFSVGWSKFTVHRIIPRDSERNIFGWVEVEVQRGVKPKTVE